eukprot:Gb_21689 [translate_table: standard]
MNFGGLLKVIGHYGSRGCFVVSSDTQVLLEKHFSFLARGIKVILVILKQCQDGLMLESVGIIDNKWDVNTNINGNWNLNNKTTIQAVVLKSWTLVNYSSRLYPTKGLDSQARQKTKWISFPISEQVKWLNRQPSKMWPFVEDAITRVIRQSVELPMEEYRPPRISSSKFSKLFLSNVTMKNEGIQVQGFKKTQITMDLDFRWGCDPSIIFVVQTLGASLPSQLKDLQVFAVAHMIFRFTDDIPYISALVVAHASTGVEVIYQHGASELSQLLILNTLKVGVISDEKLLDLLELALSANTARIVRRARELMDPDIKGKGTFFPRYAFIEEEFTRLRQALKILAETKKAIEICKRSDNMANNDTSAFWLWTVSSSSHFFWQLLDKEKQFEAPLEQLGSKMMSNSRMGNKNQRLKKSNFMYCREANKDIDDNSDSGQSEFNSMDPNKLDDIWKRTLDECRSNTVGQLLHAQGKLVSVSMGEGYAIVQLEFWHPVHQSRAERSLKSILNSFQLVWGCNVEVRISLVSLASEAEDIISKKDLVDLLKFSARKHRKRTSVITAQGRHDSESTTVNSNQRRTHRETFRETHYTRNGPESRAIRGSL